MNNADETPSDRTLADQAAEAEEAVVSASEYLRLVLLGAAIGIPGALIAVGFLALMHELEHLLWRDLPATKLVFSSLIIAALLVGSGAADAIPATILAAVAAYLGVTALERRFPGPPVRA